MKKALLFFFLLVVHAQAQAWITIGGYGGLEAPPVGLSVNGTVSATTINVSADCIITDNGTQAVIFRNVSCVLDMSVAGPVANGRDQSGNFNTDSWVYVYLIWGNSVAVAVEASANPTAPTLPTDYTHAALISAARTSGSFTNACAYSWTQSARSIRYSELFGAAGVFGVSDITLTPLGLARGVPPFASSVSIDVEFTPNSAGNYVAIWQDVSAIKMTMYGQVSGVVAGVNAYTFTITPGNELLYNVSDPVASVSIGISGWSW